MLRCRGHRTIVRRDLLIKISSSDVQVGPPELLNDEGGRHLVEGPDLLAGGDDEGGRQGPARGPRVPGRGEGQQLGGRGGGEPT